MKLRSIATILSEQSENDTQSNPDPFEPIPFTVNPTNADNTPELQRLQYKLYGFDHYVSAMNEKDNRFMNQMDTTKRLSIQAYHSKAPWIGNPSKVPSGKQAWGEYLYDPADLSPAHRAFRDRVGPKYNSALAKSELLRKAINAEKRRVKKEREQANINALANSSAAPNSSLAPSNIPALVSTGGKGKGVINPYVQDTTSSVRYAGAPSGYAFTSQMQTLYREIESALKRNGKTLSVIYAGRPYAAQGYNAINFIASTADSKVVWRKYDPGPGAGQNWLFLNGNKMNTSSFVKSTPAQQDALLKQYGVI